VATSTFAYKVRDSAGKVKSGTLEAETPAQVATKLRTMGYAPISIAEQKASGLQREITIPGSGQKVGPQGPRVFARQFATMINSGCRCCGRSRS
jgi:type IV pilus assembly protein PilC